MFVAFSCVQLQHWMLVLCCCHDISFIVLVLLSESRFFATAKIRTLLFSFFNRFYVVQLAHIWPWDFWVITSRLLHYTVDFLVRFHTKVLNIGSETKKWHAQRKEWADFQKKRCLQQIQTGIEEHALNKEILIRIPHILFCLVLRMYTAVSYPIRELLCMLLYKE